MATAVAKSARRLTNAVRVGVIVKVGNNPTVAGAIDATELAADCQTRAARKGFIYGSSVTLVAVVRHEIELAAIEEDACAIVVEVAKASGG